MGLFGCLSVNSILHELPHTIFRDVVRHSDKFYMDDRRYAHLHCHKMSHYGNFKP